MTESCVEVVAHARNGEADGGALAVADPLVAALCDRLGEPRSCVPGDERGMEAVAALTAHGRRYVLLRSIDGSDHAGPPLSCRELEIGRMIAEGHTTRTTAAVLEISPYTVATHVRRVFAKLEVRSRSAMVARLVELGLLQPDVDRGSREP